MALEINEISISMRVSGGAGPTGEIASGDEPPALDREELIEECVSRVLKALVSLRER